MAWNLQTPSNSIAYVAKASEVLRCFSTAYVEGPVSRLTIDDPWAENR
jgi:hypothetical protein